MWSYADSTSLTSSPLVGGTALAGYAWETGEAKLIAYVGSDRHVHELMMDANGKGKWQHTDLTRLVRSPEAGNDVLAGHEWTPQFAKDVVYLDASENPHIHSLMLKHGGSLPHRDPPPPPAAPPPVGLCCRAPFDKPW